MKTRSFSALLAGRYLNPLRNTVSVVTLITIVGVMLGVAAMITVLSVMNGLEKEIKSRILGFSPHVTVDYVPGPEGARAMDEWREISKELAGVDGVETTYGLVEDYLILEYSSAQTPVNFRAVDTSIESQVQDLTALLDLERYPGSSADLGFEYEAVISSTVADNVGLTVGDTFSLYSGRNLQAVKEVYNQLDYVPAQKAFGDELRAVREIFVSPTVADQREVYLIEPLGEAYQTLFGILESELRDVERDELEQVVLSLEQVAPEPGKEDKPERYQQQGWGALQVAALDAVLGLNIEEVDNASLKDIKELVLPREVKVRGVYRSSAHVRSPDLFVPLEVGQELAGLGDSVQSVALRLDQPFAAAEFAQKLAEVTPPDRRITTWMDHYGAWFELIAREQVMMSFVFMILIVIVVFCSGAVMFTVTLQKKQEIGVMKALGAKEEQIMGVFIIQGIVIGFVGAVLGVGLGLLVLVNRGVIQSGLAAMGADPFPAAFHGVNAIPADYSPSSMLAIGVGAFFLCIGAAVVPAIFASKNDPARSLRGL